MLEQLKFLRLVLIDETGVKLAITCNFTKATKGKYVYKEYISRGRNIV
ncbi:hypothetical protein ETSB_1677 [cyanobacterium endosymbiont of Epithemia turgida isolate EtSB Lake Yunoko]|nr:hypothetical protein ETSB_1677 [cyanobacterium endosymbiont of Epithemia turgida isolate EtSB Lake Yunoko]